MDQRATDGLEARSRFELAPPRRFLLPALLLLLSEHPDHGYSLLKELVELRFGRVDRPSVYRALAQLESDGLVESWADTQVAGHERRVYGLTEHGARILRTWMGVIKEERDGLDRVLRRYHETGTADALIAEVEGAWGSVLGSPHPSTSSSSPAHRPHGSDGVPRLSVVSAGDGPSPPDDGEPDAVADIGAAGDEPQPSLKRYQLDPERSVILIEVRSSVGPISFGALGVTGTVEVAVNDGEVRTDLPASAELAIAVDGLRSGNSLYDAELLRRIDARRFPTATITLRESDSIAAGSRYHLAGDLTFHGITKRTEGTVTVAFPSERQMVVDGEQAFDIRDFDLASPTVLMLRIYPDVKVRLHVEAELG